MKKVLIITGIIIASLLAAPSVSAQFNAVCDSKTQDAAICQTTGSDPISGNDGVIVRVVEMLGWIVGFASVLMIIIAGIKFITANGDAASVKSARDTIIYAAIGVAVFASSQVIARFILSNL